MSETNATTVQSYNDHIQEYIDGTPKDVTGAVKDWIDASLVDLSKDARIIEFGTAFGRDADYIDSLGYVVERTDVTPGFVDYLKANGHQAVIFDALSDELSGEYDMVFADAVLLHFTREETERVAQKVFASLAEDGRFTFSLKQGQGETWSDEKLGAPRYFCYWSSEHIEQLLAKVGFGNVTISGDSSAHNNAQWLRIIAKK